MNKWTPLWIGIASATALSFAILTVVGWFWYRSTPLRTGTIYLKMGCVSNELHTSYEMRRDKKPYPAANNDDPITWCNQDKYYLYITNRLKSTRYLVPADVWQAAQIGDSYSANCGCITQIPESERPPIACFVGNKPCK